MRNLIIGFSVACILSACGGGDSNLSSQSTAAIRKSNCEAEGRRYVEAVAYCTSFRAMVRADFYNTVALIRETVGLPALVIDPRVEDAAYRHANYLYLNNTIGHDEILGKPGFFGIKTEDRLNLSGYPAIYANEDAAATSDIAAGFEGLLSVPYHASLFLTVGPYHIPESVTS